MNAFLMLIIQSVYLLVPAYFANMAPPIAKRFNLFQGLAVPVDHGRKFSDDSYIFGQNKTYRGFLVGMIAGAFGGFLQYLLYGIPLFRSISLEGIIYGNVIFMICLGALLGFGALFGDLIESFIKRRLKIASGQRLVPWDQIDLVMGAYLCALPIIFFAVSIPLFLSSLVLTFCLHVITNHVAFYLDIRKEKW